MLTLTSASRLCCTAFASISAPHYNICKPSSHSLMKWKLTKLTAEETSSKTAIVNLVYNKETPKHNDNYQICGTAKIHWRYCVLRLIEINYFIWAGGWRVQDV